MYLWISLFYFIPLYPRKTTDRLQKERHRCSFNTRKMRSYLCCFVFLFTLDLVAVEKFEDPQCLLGKEYFDDQEQKCVHMVPCNNEGNCLKDGSVCNWNKYCEPEFCARTSDCVVGRACLFSRCMENTDHLCDVRDESCTVELPHKASDYINCTVTKHVGNSGTKENVPIDLANNSFYIKRIARTLEAVYTFSCVKGEYKIYSYINIELRDQVTEPELKMSPGPYFENGTYTINCSAHGFLQEPKYYAITKGGVKCATTSFSYNKTSGQVFLSCQGKFTKFDDNKKFECKIKPRHEPEKRTEGDIIVFTKPTTLPLYSKDSGPRRLTSEQIDNKNVLSTTIPADVRVEIFPLPGLDNILRIATFGGVCVLIGLECCKRCKKTKEKRMIANDANDRSSEDIPDPNQTQCSAHVEEIKDFPLNFDNSDLREILINESSMNTHTHL